MASTLRELSKTKYERGGTNLSKGLDCKGLFIEAMNVFGNKVEIGDVEVMAIEQVAVAMAKGEYPYTDHDCAIIEREVNNGKWEKLESPVVGCAVVMALDSMKPDKVQHLGVYIGEGKFIHIMDKRGTLITRTDHPFFKQKIRGYYKWIG